MTYYVTGIRIPIWRFAKSRWSYTDFDDLKTQLNQAISEWMGQDTKLSEMMLVECVGFTLGEYLKECNPPPYIIQDFFNGVYGDPIIEAVYGKDESSIGERLIVQALLAIRHAQVQNDQEILIDWGQYDTQTANE